ncbi:CLUMA_CG005810, isoform A [Clunio marinus]|uniref:CLUMA_CG005810, isoform A n=1 Tax=Clunio marinus TaxID=568069 RepID=A0A1J1HVX3_9DIPT|nr:CLUMA_CG005810, isoform A [Clunio marinus]
MDEMKARFKFNIEMLQCAHFMMNYHRSQTEMVGKKIPTYIIINADGDDVGWCRSEKILLYDLFSCNYNDVSVTIRSVFIAYDEYADISMTS